MRAPIFASASAALGNGAGAWTRSGCLPALVPSSRRNRSMGRFGR
jgi:hypothetical protein